MVHWDWKSLDLIFLYWLENVIIGAIMILRILVRRYGHPVDSVFPFFLAPFFAAHYGGFCYGHGIFIVSLFGKELTGDLAGMNIPEIILPLIKSHNLFWPVMALLAYQLIDWARYFSKHGFGNEGIKELTIAPYRRIVVLHITILASGFALGALNEPMFGLFLLIAFKTAMDIYHWNKDAQTASGNEQPEINEEINEDIKKKIDAFLDDPKITVNGKEIRYNSFEELKTSKHYALLLAAQRMIGGENQLKVIETYVEQQARERNGQK